METQRDFKIFSGFVLKIFAIVFMTLDHIGMMLHKSGNLPEIGTIFRVFGRLAFPLFIFLLVEGVRHTKSIGKYFIRLGILCIVFLIGQLFYYFLISKDTSGLSSPVVDLLLTATIVYLLKRKDKFSFLAILPLAWAIIVLIAKKYNC